MVQVTAIPFWQMASGRFQAMELRAHNVRVAGVLVDAISVRWTKGQIRLTRRSPFGFRVVRAGTVTGSVVMGGSALAGLFDQTGIMQGTRVRIANRELAVSGVLRLDGRRLPVDVRGGLRLVPGQGGRVLFYPRSVNGRQLPGTVMLSLFAMSQMRLPMALRMVSLSLVHNRIRVRVVGG